MAHLENGLWADDSADVLRPSRADYLNGIVTHAEYYGAIARESGVSFRSSTMLPRIKAALAKGDVHLNSIPLREWDSLAYCAKHSTGPVLKAHGDWWSQASGVCIAKQAAIDAATQD